MYSLSTLQHKLHNLHQIPPFLHNNQPTKNPNQTLQIQSPMSSSSSQSWACSKCTFLNSPSQKYYCQICNNTPSNLTSFHSSNSIEKWACKACTFLNSYSLSNCEVCDTRSSLSNLEDLEFIDNFDGSSSVGTVFFPLRRCNSGRVQESGQLGIQEMGQTQLGSCQFVDQGVNLSVGSNFGSSKRVLQDQNIDKAGGVNSSPEKKEENGVAPPTARLVGNAEENVSIKRKLCDLSDFVDKPSQVDGFRNVKSSGKSISALDSVKGGKSNTNSSSVSTQTTEHTEIPGMIKILSYNVWFAEDVELFGRMQAIGDLIELHSPDIICFQEVIPEIYVIFQNSTWWNKYRCSISNVHDVSQAYFCMQLSKLPVKSFNSKPFSYSPMGRELSIAEIEVNKNKSLVVATSHLESPCPGPPTWDQMFSKERVNQAKEAVNFLQQNPNVIFCGDMNWDDNRDGRFPLPEGWFDAWEKLRPAEIGYTYDTKSNKMLTGNRSLRKRLDRFVCFLTDFEIRSIDMIGTDEIPDLIHRKTRKVKNKIQELICPVLPSDHYGLLLSITSK